MLQKFKRAIFLKQPHTVNLIMHNLHYKFVCIYMVVNCIMLDRLFCLLQIELMMMIKASEWVYRSLSSTMNSWDFLSYVHHAKVWRAQKSSEMATKLQFLILKVTSEFFLLRRLKFIIRKKICECHRKALWIPTHLNVI